MLKDNIHLNDHGQFLMAEIIKSYLKDEGIPVAASMDDRIRLLDPAFLPDDGVGHLRILFNGNRIDAVFRNYDSKNIPVLIDGKSPCQLADAYRFSRVTPYPGSNWPVLLRVQQGASALVAETWTARIFDVSEDLKHFRFVLAGSLTGLDGEGISDEKFVSKSGRVVINPEDWNLSYARTVIKSSFPPQFEARWLAECHGSDMLNSSVHSIPWATPLTIVQGLANGRHVLQLPVTAAKSIAMLRIYRPLSGRLDSP